MAKADRVAGPGSERGALHGAVPHCNEAMKFGGLGFMALGVQCLGFRGLGV